MELEKIFVRLSGIVEDSITDGPGLRTAFFTQGCPHRCNGCHNAHTWSFEGGAEYSLSDIYAKVADNPILGGVTFSGGEPMSQIENLLPLIKKIKTELHLEVAIYTGYDFEELLAQKNPSIIEALQYTDTIIDGKFILAKRNLNNKFKGSDNQRIIDVQKSLADGKTVLDTSDRWN